MMRETAWDSAPRSQESRETAPRGAGQQLKKKDLFDRKLQNFWKQFPDTYFSWALSLAVVAEGHVFVDLLPDTNQMYNLTKDETESIGSRFENAAREYLNTKQVIRIVCAAEMTPEYIYFVFATNMLQNQNNAEENLPFNVNGTNTSLKATGGRRQGTKGQTQQLSGGQQVHPNDKGTSQMKLKRGARAAAGPRQRPTIKQSSAPFVLILQDIENLSYETQMAMVEILTKRSMPGSFVPNLLVGASGVAEGAIPVRGTFELKAPFVVVGLSSKLQVPVADYSASRMSRIAIDTLSHDSELTCPQLFQSFLLRIPIKLPERMHILSIIPQTHYSPLSLHSNLLPSVPFRHHIHHGHHHHHMEDEHEPYAPFRGISGDQPAPPPPGPPPHRNRRELWARANDTVHHGKLVIPKPSSEDEPKPYYMMTVDLLQKLETTSQVHISFELDCHIRNIITSLRMHPFVLSGPSPRVAKMLASCVRAVAAIMHDLPYATPLHVAEIVVEVLAHQVTLSFDSFPNAVSVPSGGTARSHPREWHPLTAARYIVAETCQFLVPAPGREHR